MQETKYPSSKALSPPRQHATRSASLQSWTHQLFSHCYSKLHCITSIILSQLHGQYYTSYFIQSYQTYIVDSGGVQVSQEVHSYTMTQEVRKGSGSWLQILHCWWVPAEWGIRILNKEKFSWRSWSSSWGRKWSACVQKKCTQFCKTNQQRSLQSFRGNPWSVSSQLVLQYCYKSCGVVLWPETHTVIEMLQLECAQQFCLNFVFLQWAWYRESFPSFSTLDILQRWYAIVAI